MKKLLTAALLTFSLSANSALIVDDFSADQGPLEVDRAGAIFSSVLGSMLGGERDVSVTNFSDANNRGTTVEVTNGSFFFSAGSGASSQFTIQWDGVDGSMDINPYGLGGVDFSDVSQFVTSIVESDLNAWFDVTFWSNGIAETVAFPIPGVDSPGRNAFFTVNDFALTDFSNIGAIQVRGNILSPISNERVRSYDLHLDNVKAVPEPVSSALFGLAIAGLALYSDRRSNKQKMRA